MCNGSFPKADGLISGQSGVEKGHFSATVGGCTTSAIALIERLAEISVAHNMR